MAHRIPTATQTPPATATPKKAVEQTATISTPAPKTATVAQTKATISDAAKAALLEATETPAQTAKEARGNDPQAKRLLAKEAAQQQPSVPKTS